MSRSARAAHVINLGLPRTGTTSTTDALARLQLRCLPLVAQQVGMHLERLEDLPLDVPEGPALLICSLRPVTSWVESAQGYFRSRVDAESLKAVHVAHGIWVRELAQERPVGLFHVAHGWPGLYRALADASEGRALPVLNARAG